MRRGLLYLENNYWKGYFPPYIWGPVILLHIRHYNSSRAYLGFPVKTHFADYLSDLRIVIMNAKYVALIPPDGSTM